MNLPILQLRLHNPFLANRQLRVGQLIAYPTEPRNDVAVQRNGHLEYVTRIGDNYFNIAGTMGVNLDTMRKDNSLWHLENLPPGLRLTLSTNWKGTHEVHAVQAGETLHTIAENLKSDPWRIIWDNQIWNQNLETGMTLRVRKAPPKPTYLVHRVTSGENLGVIARRYGTTVRAIQSANTLGRGTLIRIGQRLRIPTVK